MSIVVSVAAIVTQMAVSHVIRGFCTRMIDNELVKGCLVEMVAAAEMCGTCFELIIIADNYGVGAYAIFLFLMTIWWSNSWGSATACTYTLLEEYVETGSNPVHVLLKIIAQVIGAIVSFSWMKRLWMIEVAATHMGRGVDDCEADLKVPPIFGFLIEAVLTCACRLFSRTLGEHEPKFASSIDSFFATSMVILAFNSSGGYFNPVLATGLKWNCRGHTNAEHFVVYWTGSILGAMMALRIWTIPSLKAALVAPFKTKQE
ncbi:Aquaporin-11 [Chionoecetes opilio]|uniref:Aquaporin-11 n=1 Tax=Chionoecetes opilio TaxID=41210 RepID=A0A8J4XYC6_CHIOP|nr:Aquaporin-11 [Chionoecetes opilio]